MTLNSLIDSRALLALTVKMTALANRVYRPTLLFV
jgi:hypothetical protein